MPRTPVDPALASSWSAALRMGFVTSSRGPTQLRQTAIQFAERAEGEVVWFNACPLMFESKELCDVLLRPFLDNPSITLLRLVLDHAQREHWHTRVEATLQDYLGRSTVAPRIPNASDDFGRSSGPAGCNDAELSDVQNLQPGTWPVDKPTHPEDNPF